MKIEEIEEQMENFKEKKSKGKRKRGRQAGMDQMKRGRLVKASKWEFDKGNRERKAKRSVR